MIRKIIRIDEEKCNGCGLCAEACHEGAIDMVDGKAKLVRENFCDGFGDCLPACPTGAITFEEREAPEYDEAAVKESQRKNMEEKMGHDLHAGGCPGSRLMQLDKAKEENPSEQTQTNVKPISRLAQWPCQIKLVPTQAPFFDGARLLIAADCTAYAYGSFHQDFIRGRIALIGCPKLDAQDYTQKLAAILSGNDVKSVTVARMEVPCCGGIEQAARRAIQACGKDLPCRVVTITTDGRIRE